MKGKIIASIVLAVIVGALVLAFEDPAPAPRPAYQSAPVDDRAGSLKIP